MREPGARLVPPTAVGRRLNAFLIARGLTQEAFAERVGVSRFSVSQLVNGTRVMTHEMALRLERATGVRAEDWMTMDLANALEETRRRMGKELRKIERCARA